LLADVAHLLVPRQPDRLRPKHVRCCDGQLSRQRIVEVLARLRLGASAREHRPVFLGARQRSPDEQIDVPFRDSSDRRRRIHPDAAGENRAVHHVEARVRPEPRTRRGDAVLPVTGHPAAALGVNRHGLAPERPIRIAAQLAAQLRGGVPHEAFLRVIEVQVVRVELPLDAQALIPPVQSPGVIGAHAEQHHRVVADRRAEQQEPQQRERVVQRAAGGQQVRRQRMVGGRRLVGGAVDLLIRDQLGAQPAQEPPELRVHAGQRAVHDRVDLALRQLCGAGEVAHDPV
jgi:hypothetical protein